MSSDKNKKSKRKSYFFSANPNKKRRSDLNLGAGMKGFLCTCNGNEKGCIREALNLLDEYDSRLHPENSPEDTKKTEQEDDIEKALKEEVINAKAPDKKFRPVETGANNCLFISTTIDDPVKLVETIMKDVKDTKFAKNRHLIRLVPIQVTCKAYNEDIKKAVDNIFDEHFKTEPTTYCIIINKRSNNNLFRNEVTDDLARLVKDRNINHKVDLKNPTKTVIVEIIRNICCLSVVNSFYEFKKYNLTELASNRKEEVSKSLSNEESLSVVTESPGVIGNEQVSSVTENTESSGVIEHKESSGATENKEFSGVTENKESSKVTDNNEPSAVSENLEPLSISETNDIHKDAVPPEK